MMTPRNLAFASVLCFMIVINGLSIQKLTMPSRKRAQGKARRTKAQAKAKTKKPAAVVATNRQPELSSVMQQIHICNHGLPCQVEICARFVYALLNEYNAAAIRRGDNSIPRTFTALHAMNAKEEYNEVRNDASKMTLIVSYLVSLATGYVKEGNMESARIAAHYACYFEEYIAAVLNGTQATMYRAKISELLRLPADEHTLISYLKHRIHCRCLDEMYKQVKTTKKMGLCLNEDCCHPDGMVERSSLLNCTRCRFANYCSQECQEADWPRHKKLECDEIAKQIARFDSKQNSKLSQI
eukprot:scaffold33690_cov202-Skeletonema_dohrnii-CCMP3373.AAC.3